MDYLIVKKMGDGTKLYLDREGEFGVKSLAPYAEVGWLGIVLRTCFSYWHKVHIEEAT